MPHAMAMPSTGLQALILCGPGSSFPTFTSNPDENPKALLPIANRPMIWYPIDFCHRMGITNITLICPPSASKAMNSAFSINPFLTSLPLPRPDILAPADLTQNTGTAEILRLPEVRNSIESDFLVLPCDLVCDLGGDKLLQAWLVKSASLTDLLGKGSCTKGPHARHSGGLGVWYNTKTAASKVKGEETDFIATTSLPPSQQVGTQKGSIFSDLSKLVYSMPTDSLNDLMEEKKSLSIRHGLLRVHPRVRMYTAHRDAHIYIFPRWILDFVKENERLESIGEDVIGWWAKAGWQAGLADKLQITSLCESSNDDNDGDSTTPESITSPRENADASYSKQFTTSSGNAQQGNRDDTARNSSTFDVPPVLAYIHPSSEGQQSGPTIRRVDTAQLLLAASLQLAKLESVEEVGADAASPFAHARKVAYPEGVKSRTTITKQDSLIAENVTVEEKTAIKESVIGANCQIKEGAKLSQCLLMDGVVIGKGCKLSKCILGKRCVIGDYSVLTDCEVQENLLVEPRTEDKDNKLMSSEGLEATEAEMDEVLQEVDREVAAVTDEAIEE